MADYRWKTAWSVAYILAVVAVGVGLEISKHGSLMSSSITNTSQAWQSMIHSFSTDSAIVELYTTVCTMLAVALISLYLFIHVIVVSVLAWRNKTVVSGVKNKHTGTSKKLSIVDMVSLGIVVIVFFVHFCVALVYCIKTGLAVQPVSSVGWNVLFFGVFLAKSTRVPFLMFWAVLFLIIILSAIWMPILLRLIRLNRLIRCVHSTVTAIVWNHLAATVTLLVLRTIMESWSSLCVHAIRGGANPNITDGNCNSFASNRNDDTCSFSVKPEYEDSTAAAILVSNPSVVVLLASLVILCVVVRAVSLLLYQQQGTNTNSETDSFNRLLQLVTVHLTFPRKQQVVLLSLGLGLLAADIAATVVANKVSIEKSFLPILIYRTVVASIMTYLTVSGIVTLYHNVTKPGRMPLSDVIPLTILLLGVLCDKVINLVVCGKSLHYSFPTQIVSIIEQVIWILQALLQTGFCIFALQREGRWPVSYGCFPHVFHVTAILFFTNLGNSIFDQFGGDHSYMYNPTTAMYLGIGSDNIISYQQAWSCIRAVTGPLVVLFRIASFLYCLSIRRLHAGYVSPMESERSLDS